MDRFQDSHFIRSKTDGWRLGIWEKQTILVFLIRGIVVIFVIKNQLFSVYHLLVKVHSFPRRQTIFQCVIFLGIFSLSLECM